MDTIETPKAKTKSNAYLSWFLRIIGTLFAFALVLFGVVVTWGLYRDAKAKEFAGLDPISQRAAVYDAYWKIINEKFYDKNFNGLDWQAEKKIGLEKAKAAKDAIALWQVLQNESQLLMKSHVEIGFPESKSLKPLENRSNIVDPPIDDDEFTNFPNGKFEYDPIDIGWNMSQIYRGQGVLTVVGEVRPKSLAAKLGIEPGWIVSRSEIIGGNTQKFHFIGDFAKIRGDHIELNMKASRTDFDAKFPEELTKALENIRIQYDFNLGNSPVSFGYAPKSFESKIFNENTIYLRFDNFETLEKINKAIDFIDKNQGKNLILDFRFNSGGTSHVMQWFLSNIIGANQKIGTVLSREKSKGFGTYFIGKKINAPIIVLIGPASASAAEICAKELRIHANAKLIGRRSKGAVLLAKQRKLPDGTRLTVPVKSFLSSDGSPIEGNGVKPDIEIFPTSAELNAGRDVVLERAIIEFGKMEKSKPN